MVRHTIRQTISNRKSRVEDFSVPQKVYLRWVRQQLDDEQACLELPFTILLLFSFSMMAILSLGQEIVYSVEQAIEKDLTENSNFAFSNYMGHKGLVDAHSFADFWSWARLGFLPLVIQPSWAYSESRADDVANVFDLNMAPAVEPRSNWEMGAYSSGRALPIRGDYLHYNRILGGVRFRQQVAPRSYGSCKFPGSAVPREAWERWFAKPCTPAYKELPFAPDTSDGEVFLNPEREEWMLTDLDSFDRMLAQMVDMEDGCAQMDAKNRTAKECYCLWCQKQNPPLPWLTEQTQRLEVGMATYNSEHGLLTLTGVNFWFSRGGRMKKRVELMSAWIDFSQPTVQNAPLIFFQAVWLLLLAYIVVNEGKEIVSVMMNAESTWLKALSQDYIGFWNVVDWISIVIAAAVLGYSLELFIQTSSLQGSVNGIVQANATEMGREAYTVLVQDFFFSFEEVCAQEKTYRTMLCVYPVMMMLRLFKSFAAQPRLAVVTDTLGSASQDLLHFGIVLTAVFGALCLSAVLIFGRDIEDFGNLVRSGHTAVRMMFGDWDWEPMEKVTLQGAMLWFTVFMVLVVIILLNMLLAIIMDNYMHVKKQSASAQSLAKQVSEMWRRRQMLKRKERVRLNDIWDAFYREAHGMEKAMCKSERPINKDFLMDLVPGIPETQAARTVQNSWKEHIKATTVPFDIEHASVPLQKFEALTRRIRSGLYFAYDRLEFFHTRPAGKFRDSQDKVMQQAEEEVQSLMAHLESAKERERDKEKTVVEFVSKETLRLSSQAASRLATDLQAIDKRQARLENRQDSMTESVREMHLRMLNLQSCATSLVSKLEKVIHEDDVKKRKTQASAWRNKLTSNVTPGMFDACSPDIKEDPIPAVSSSLSTLPPVPHNR